MPRFQPFQVRLIHSAVLVLPPIVALPACTGAQAGNAGTARTQDAPNAGVEAPLELASFARLVGGQWWVTFASGETAGHAWEWGPGEHSMRKVTTASGALGNEWAGDLLYWHPGRKQVRMLTMHGDVPAVGRGVGEGSMNFDGETANAVFDLYQPRSLRRLGSRWTFDGTDEYDDELLEDVGKGLMPMNKWRFKRVHEPSTPRPATAGAAPPTLPQHLAFLKALPNTRWQAPGATAPQAAFDITSTFEWIPSLEVLRVRVIASPEEGIPIQEFDVYVYHHLGVGVVRCLALSSAGGVYEGDLTVINGGALQLNLTGYEGDWVVPRIVRIDFKHDGALRGRVWSASGGEPTLLLDADHHKVQSAQD